MTTQDADTPERLEKLQTNISKIEELSQRLVTALAQKKTIHPGLHGPGEDLYVKAASAYFAEMMSNPAKIMEHQVAYWGKSLVHYLEAQQSLASGKLQPPEDTGLSDYRFANPIWDEHPYFNFIKQQYLLSSQAISNAAADLDGLSDVDQKRLRYFSRQIVDMMSPTNFLGTNP